MSFCRAVEPAETRSAPCCGSWPDSSCCTLVFSLFRLAWRTPRKDQRELRVLEIPDSASSRSSTHNERDLQERLQREHRAAQGELLPRARSTARAVKAGTCVWLLRKDRRVTAAAVPAAGPWTGVPVEAAAQASHSVPSADSAPVPSAPAQSDSGRWPLLPRSGCVAGHRALGSSRRGGLGRLRRSLPLRWRTAGCPVQKHCGSSS